MREVTAIEPKWLTEVAPSFFKVADQNTISKRKKMEKVQPLFDKCVDAVFLFASPTKTDDSHCAGTPSIRTHGVFRSSSGRRAPVKPLAEAKSLYQEGMLDLQDFIRNCAETRRALAVSSLFLSLLFPLCALSLPHLKSAVVQSNYTAQCSPPAESFAGNFPWWRCFLDFADRHQRDSVSFA